MKSIMSYMGGKSRLAARIIELMPPHSVYAEPFCGSAAVFFRKPVPAVTNGDHYRECLNDLNGEIVNLFAQLRDNGAELKRRLSLTPYSREVFAWARAVSLGEAQPVDEIDRALACFYRFNGSFGGMGAQWAMSTSNQNQTNTYRRRVDALHTHIERLRSVYLESRPALHVIEQWSSPQTLIYCDPPYVGTRQDNMRAGGGAFTESDLSDLLDALASTPAAWILSGYSHPLIEERAQSMGCLRVEWPARCAVMPSESRQDRDTSDRTEVVWCRGRTADPTGAALEAMLSPAVQATFRGDLPTGKAVERIERARQSTLFDLMWA